MSAGIGAGKPIRLPPGMRHLLHAGRPETWDKNQDANSLETFNRLVDDLPDSHAAIAAQRSVGNEADGR